MAWVTAGWLKCAARAAALTLPSRATEEKTDRWRRLGIGPDMGEADFTTTRM